MNMGVELEQTGYKKEAVELLEKASDTSLLFSMAKAAGTQ
jgi:hypothetical protein